jgi:hypothetical protein
MFAVTAGVLAAMAFAGFVYLGRERLGAAGVGLAALRTIALAALVVAFVNPARDVRHQGGPTTVLVDASLSMGAAGAHWRTALDSARARRGADPRSTMLRFGTGVRDFDTLPPGDGTSTLADALRSAAARGGATVVVTDGEVDDWASLPSELVRAASFVVVPRDTAADIALLDVQLPDAVQRDDSIQMDLTIGTWRVTSDTLLPFEIWSGATRLVRTMLHVARGTGTAQRAVVLNARALPLGTAALRFALTTHDAEPRDDERLRLVTVVETPAIVVVSDPADYEGRFLFSGMASVAPGRTRGFARVVADKWVDMRTLAAVRAQDVTSAARQAALLVVRGDFTAAGTTGARWTWSAGGTAGVNVLAGDWYAASAPASPLAANLSGAAWDSLPPLTALTPVEAAADGWVALTARLGRGGVERAVVVGRDSGGARRMVTAGVGLWRWSLRGGAPREAYRALLAAGIDWLLAQPAGHAARLTASPVAPRGVALRFRWQDANPPDSLAITLTSDSARLSRVLRFQGATASALVPPGVYRWQAPAAAASGVVAVERYSDEFHPRPISVQGAVSAAGFTLVIEQARERWWLFGIAMLAFIGEWVWRQRRGLP